MAFSWRHAMCCAIMAVESAGLLTQSSSKSSGGGHPSVDIQHVQLLQLTRQRALLTCADLMAKLGVKAKSGVKPWVPLGHGDFGEAFTVEVNGKKMVLKVGFNIDAEHEAVIGAVLNSFHTPTFVHHDSAYMCKSTDNYWGIVQSQHVKYLEKYPLTTQMHFILMEKVLPGKNLLADHGLSTNLMKHLVFQLLYDLRNAWETDHFLHYDITANNLWFRDITVNNEWFHKNIRLHDDLKDKSKTCYKDRGLRKKRCFTSADVRLVLADYGASSIHCVPDDKEKCIPSALVPMSGRASDLTNIHGLAYDFFYEKDEVAYEQFRALVAPALQAEPGVVVSASDFDALTEHHAKETQEALEEHDPEDGPFDESNWAIDPKYGKDLKNTHQYTAALDNILNHDFFNEQ